MKISSKYVGAKSLPLEVEITSRQCMSYAASIGDENPMHLDDMQAGGIIAPPMLAVSLTWRISESFAEYWKGADFDFNVLARQVHYSEHIEWKRPMRPGDRLSIQGEVAAILPHRAGSHLILEYTAREASGDIVFIERIGGLLRGVQCEDEGRGEDLIAPAPVLSDRTPLWRQTVSLSPLAAHIYDVCADVHFPIHISPAFAHSVGLPGIIFQGTGTLAHAVREITLREGNNNPSRLRSVQCRFTGMVRPGSDIIVEALWKEPEEQRCRYGFKVVNAQGKTVVDEGRITLSV